jgi:hypothetical protein
MTGIFVSDTTRSYRCCSSRRSVRAVAGDLDPMALASERFDQNLGEIALVVDDED